MANADFDQIPSNTSFGASQSVRRNSANSAFELFTATADGLLPSQSGNSGKFLSTNGSVVSWASIATGITIGTTPISSGTNNRVLFQSSGNVSQSANLLFDGSTFTAKAGSASVPAIIGQYGHASPSSAPFQILTSAGAVESEWKSKGDTNQFIGKTVGNLSLSGTQNSGFGFSVLNSLTSGGNNAGMGGYALSSLTTGSDNLALGYLASYLLTTGSNNVSIGSNAGRLNQTANGNLAIGTAALYNATAGGNVGIGTQAAYNNTSGVNNVGIGENSLFSNSTGNYNTAVGTQAGNSALGSRNVFLGFQAGYYETGANKLYIANDAGDYLIKGDFSAHTLELKGTTTISDGYNLVFGTTTGTKIGTSSTEKIALWGGTPVTQRTIFGGITDATGGTSGTTINIDDGMGGIDVAALNDALATIINRLNATRNILLDVGIAA